MPTDRLGEGQAGPSACACGLPGGICQSCHAAALRASEAALAEVRADNERLAGLLKTTRDANLVDMTADRDSWHQQCEMARELLAIMTKERDEAWGRLAQVVAAHKGTRELLVEANAKHGKAEAQLRAARAEATKAVKVCEAVDAHYSASLDYQPPYVRVAREALAAIRAPRQAEPCDIDSSEVLSRPPGEGLVELLKSGKPVDALDKYLDLDPEPPSSSPPPSEEPTFCFWCGADGVQHGEDCNPLVPSPEPPRAPDWTCAAGNPHPQGEVCYPPCKREPPREEPK